LFRFDEELKVYLHREPVDFRLSINGLAVLVEQALGLDPFASCAYVFSNRRRDRVKILGWERNGFWLLLKRLEGQVHLALGRCGSHADGRAAALAAGGHRHRGGATPLPSALFERGLKER